LRDGLAREIDDHVGASLVQLRAIDGSRFRIPRNRVGDTRRWFTVLARQSNDPMAIVEQRFH
jgi:hypothetical protein